MDLKIKIVEWIQQLKEQTWLWFFQQLASHGLFDVHVKATGDIHIDDHHTNEDIALAIGTVLPTAKWAVFFFFSSCFYVLLLFLETIEHA